MKRIYCFICFVFILLLTPFIVEAKSFDNEKINISFGEENSLNLKYNGYNKFSVEEDKTFYYNGSQYTLSEEDISVGYIIVEGDKLVYEDGDLYSSRNHEFYALPVRVIIKSGEYEFAQELCYKYDGVERCSIDKGDTHVVEPGTYDSNYFYGFLPFYDENIRFDYLYFNFTFTNVSDISDVIKVEDFGFFLSEGDHINYEDYFSLSYYPLHEENSLNNGKEYIYPYCFNHYFDEGVNLEIVQGYAMCGNELYLTMYLEGSGSQIAPVREYNISLEIYVGDDYSIPYTFNNADIYVLRAYYYFDFIMYNYLETFDGKIKTNEGEILYIPIDNVIEYNKNYKTLNYVSFKIGVKYVCSSNCSEFRAVTSQTSKYKIYDFDIDDPELDFDVVEGVQLPNYYTVASKDEVVLKVGFKDNNGVNSVGYYISSNPSDSNYANFTYTSVNLGEEIRVSGEYGAYYIYYRLKDNATDGYLYIVQKVIIDDVSPVMNRNNFNSYSSEASYNNIVLNIGFEDAMLQIEGTTIKAKGYYQIVNENERESLTVDDVYETNLYDGGVTLNKDNISEDGVYSVCFVLVDFIGNKSDLICSNKYYVDVSALTKEEVSATSNDSYVNRVKTIITISGVELNKSFKCGLFIDEITNPNLLINNCYNGVESTISVSGEAIYSLWIYASDSAGNYNLIKLDNNYYVDSIAPRIVTIINGNKDVYSNNVTIDVTYSDMSMVDTSLLSYEFYLATYNENNFKAFTLEEGITYPFDYYGGYKLAIKVCDIIGNCKINTSSDTYLIDTAKILLELVGDKSITILQYEKYKELGAKASKGNAGKNVISLDYKIEGEVNSKKPGVYKITYTAGEGINRVVIEREVIVKESKIHIIILVSTLVLGELIILSRLFIKRKKNDNI